MNSAPTIFVIVPIFNVERYVRQSLDSLFAQVGCGIFVICVNDGSTDSSADIVSSFCRQHRNSMLITTSNQGLSSARNTGVCTALSMGSQTDYLFFFDSDDCLSPGYLSALLNASQHNNRAIVCSSFSFFTSGSFSKYRGMDSCFGVYSSLEATEILLQDTTLQSHAWGKLFPLETWKDLLFPSGCRFMEDQRTIFQSFLKANCIVLLPLYGYEYRQREGSLLKTSITNQKVLDALTAYLVPCRFNYSCDRPWRKRLIGAALNAFAANFLMYWWRFDKKTATQAQRDTFREICQFEKANRAVLTYRPNNRSNKLKKFAFLFLRPLYGYLYKRWKH